MRPTVRSDGEIIVNKQKKLINTLFPQQKKICTNLASYSLLQKINSFLVRHGKYRLKRRVFENLNRMYTINLCTRNNAKLLPSFLHYHRRFH